MHTLHIHGTSAHGEGVGRLADGSSVFVDGALPGDVLQVALTHARKKVQYGHIVELKTASPGRCLSRCHVENCGGCPWRMASLDLQAQQKRQSIVQTLRRLGGLDVEALLGPIQEFGDGWGRRHRVRLHASYWPATADRAAGWRLGYLQRRSRALVPLSACPVIWPELERLALAIAQGVALLPQQAGLSTVELAYSRRDRRGGVRLVAQGPLRLFRQSFAWLSGADVLGAEILAKDGRLRHGHLELRYDHAQADQYDLRFEAGLFTQADPRANDALVAAVLAQVRAHTNLQLCELFAGIGNFTVPLALAGARVAAFEIDRRAAVLCEHNARAAGAGASVVVHPEPAESGLLQAARADVVLLDPPRGGARAVVEALAQRGPPQVLYVSCDAGTLARDAALLCAGGYVLRHLQAFDLFAQTPHVETLSVFER